MQLIRQPLLLPPPQNVSSGLGRAQWSTSTSTLTSTSTSRAGQRVGQRARHRVDRWVELDGHRPSEERHLLDCDRMPRVVRYARVPDLRHQPVEWMRRVRLRPTHSLTDGNDRSDKVERLPPPHQKKTRKNAQSAPLSRKVAMTHPARVPGRVSPVQPGSDCSGRRALPLHSELERPQRPVHRRP